MVLNWGCKGPCLPTEGVRSRHHQPSPLPRYSLFILRT